MNTRQLHYLRTIAERGSLSQASLVLGISQPALSKVLSEWESLCGGSLFLRYRRRLIPTALGREVLDYAEKIVDEQNRMMLTMRSVTGNDRQNIRVCTAPNRGAIIYSRIYNQFSRRYPDISLHLTELYAREQPHAIRRGQVDLALGAGTDSDIVCDIPFVREELLVSLPSSHPLAGQKSIRLRDLRDTPFVLQGKRHSIRAIADQLFAEAGFEPVVSFESDDVILLDSMMHQAVGAGLVSKAHVFPCDELAYLSLDPPVYQKLHLRYPLGHTLTEPERYLASLLIRERLADPRYEPIKSPEADELFAMVEAADDAYKSMEDAGKAADNANAAKETAAASADYAQGQQAIAEDPTKSKTESEEAADLAGAEAVDANVDLVQANVTKAYVDRKAQDAADKKEAAEDAAGAASGSGYAAASSTSKANTGDNSKTLVWLTTLATAGIALAKGLVGRLKTQN